MEHCLSGVRHSAYCLLSWDAHSGVYRYERLVSTALEVGILRMWMMGLSGFPSLLAVAGLLGFAFVELLLPH